ncbi:MAG TPA: diaminobutyrate--2-oxoglutarate transaminase family protein [Actinocrinis sp.]|jgi:diaminobutyrate-2-oxoglutarate transaminase|uniref:diaminobutyrate--2-oxoglutarate transaminase family protein n=1 Tax=Actinocrinis sp. TaxID=1920516 RepID=UPI002DDCBDCC|nr:diaminobutyrate--2-oxoglutarate transaminase family protein [Actinocrinis sp.]HEV3169960.1 diaminobutyrate--2-oxoglutarate transaminase family protein [Actinocrinis sp.]
MRKVLFEAHRGGGSIASRHQAPVGPEEPDESGKTAILARQAKRESAARTYARHLPIVPVRAEGMTVYGADGRVYLDCLAGAGTLALGHNHPVAIGAIRRVLDSGAPLHVLDLATPIKDEFTETLLGVLPRELAADARIQFCGPSGADAVEAALKLARTATGETGLIAFTGAYHGMTAATLAASGDTSVRIAARVSDAGVTRLPFPQDYRCPYGVGGEGGVRIATERLRRLLADPGSGLTPPAALLVEPVQGEGGVIPAPDDWLRAVREITRAHRIPLIADEVQTGLGRTGELWGVDHAGIAPDVMVLSKAIGGGLPLAVIVYRSSLDRWTEGAHAGTFRGHQLAMAAGTTTIKYVREHDLAARARKVGERLERALREAARQYPVVGDVRGRGLMLGLEVVYPDAAPDPLGARPAAPGLARRLRAAAFERGLLVELGGHHGAVLRLLPPLTITDAEADRVIGILTDALAQLSRDPRP